MGRTHTVDEVSCAHSGQKPVWLISRNSFEPTFTEYAVEIAQFSPLIISSLEQEKHSCEYIIPCNHDAVPSARHQFGNVLYHSYCSSRPGHARVSPPGQDTLEFHLQKNTHRGFVACPPQKKVFLTWAVGCHWQARSHHVSRSPHPPPPPRCSPTPRWRRNSPSPSSGADWFPRCAAPSALWLKPSDPKGDGGKETRKQWLLHSEQGECHKHLSKSQC